MQNNYLRMSKLSCFFILFQEEAKKVQLPTDSFSVILLLAAEILLCTVYSVYNY